MWDNIDVVVGKIYKGKRYLDIFIGNIYFIYIIMFFYIYWLYIYIDICVY